jgi:hypothetical protein
MPKRKEREIFLPAGILVTFLRRLIDGHDARAQQRRKKSGDGNSSAAWEQISYFLQVDI